MLIWGLHYPLVISVVVFFQREREKSTAAAVFGDATPVDTASRDRQVEEKLMKERERLEKQAEDGAEKEMEGERRRRSSEEDRGSRGNSGDRGPPRRGRGRGYSRRGSRDGYSRFL